MENSVLIRVYYKTTNNEFAVRCRLKEHGNPHDRPHAHRTYKRTGGGHLCQLEK